MISEEFLWHIKFGWNCSYFWKDNWITDSWNENLNFIIMIKSVNFFSNVFFIVFSVRFFVFSSILQRMKRMIFFWNYLTNSMKKKFNKLKKRKVSFPDNLKSLQEISGFFFKNCNHRKMIFFSIDFFQSKL